jgi:hyperosmotically inducible periplasmic protein
MNLKVLTIAIAVSLFLSASACSTQARPTYKDSVKTALEQADLKDVKVSEDADKNTITLGGTLHSEDAKQKAASVAKANAGSRIVVNEVSVQPVGQESEAKSVTSNLDDGIENNYKAALIAKGLDKQSIRFDAKNGVLTLKGHVKTTSQRKEAEQLAQAVPNVQQVVNEIDVRR